ncbi:hypothetical protein BJ322DRAFT_172060 [Thelephora terrestris]|uniref:MYND-type domain-containing protein n=1 Tax=Thelephora terrestris TaxID=56493 RepID=A0A9P6L570_9AGAM|nr:hypothetical protein BJ322DRAFT_172060 [Thelephora terrestris]
MTNLLHCKTCGKNQTTPGVKLRKCSKCRGSAYCSPECQREDWPAHKKLCGDWYDKYRKCQDGAKHEGQLELITWVSEEEGVGFGASCFEDCDELKDTFETEFEGNLERFYKYRPHAFRWTCCGMPGDMDYGCDHHGTGSKPCSCDFCRMGKPLPERIYNKKPASRMGLNLPRGPDPRSFNTALAISAATGRSLFGMEM